MIVGLTRLVTADFAHNAFCAPPRRHYARRASKSFLMGVAANLTGVWRVPLSNQTPRQTRFCQAAQCPEVLRA